MKVLSPALWPFKQLFLDVGLARGRQQGGHPVQVGDDAVDHLACRDLAGPAHGGGHAETAFPGGRLFAVERGGAAVRPGEDLGAVVGAVDDDGVVGDVQLVEQIEQLADMAVMLDHAVRVETVTGLALGLRLEVGEDVHARGVEPDEKRLVSLDRPV